ncbi:hypothetical protein [Arthrobacter flavus]|uniref:Antitoxin Xre/MbcA/ParS-like toxin-binding domain-containing protein n=1 Tax=Arthrobacter flavus TaxID=95172 RepID=A0ABW4QAD2_9MICC
MGIEDGIAQDHGHTALPAVHEMIQRLNSHLGMLLVATLAGSKDAKLPHKWALPNGTVPEPAIRKRLELAHHTWVILMDAETPDLARAWFIGGNPFLKGDTPLTAIREDRHQEVAVALEAFLEDRQDV